MVLCAFAHPTADSSCFSLVSAPEVWLRGAVPDVPPLLQPVAHSLLQCREEMATLLPALSSAEIAARPGGAASAGYHARHAIGSIDRLLTYARGEALSAAQMQVLAAEKTEDKEPGAGMRPASCSSRVRETRRGGGAGESRAAFNAVGGIIIASSWA